MKKPKYKPVPKAFTTEIVGQIWDEVIPSDYDNTLRKAVVEGLVVPTRGLFTDFFQAAMEHPHFATATDFTTLFKMSAPAVDRIMKEVRRRARENRA